MNRLPRHTMTRAASFKDQCTVISAAAGGQLLT